MPSAWAEKAERAVVAANGITACAVVTGGFGNVVRALVNAVIIVTQVKAEAPDEAGIRCPEGAFPSGTSTDAVVIAATGRGPRCRFGGPAGDPDWVGGQPVTSALEAGIHRWIEEHS